MLTIKRLPDCDVVVFRFNHLEDWLRDFHARPILTRIGHVHDGFHTGMEHAWADIRLLLTKSAIVTGHSLGAGRATIPTGFMVKDGLAPVARVVFGEPKPGFADLAQIIAGVPGRSCRNGDSIHHDLVADVLFSFPPEQYTHPMPIIPFCAPPATDDHWGAFC